MKILVIADLHGLDVWKEFVDKEDFDRIIFLWDYVDSFHFTDSEIFENLTNIIKFKKDNPEKVILLLWNHDIQYIWEWNDCSWKRYSMATWLWFMFNDNIDLFKVVHEEGWYLFSHAWFTWDWINHNEEHIAEFFPEWTFEDLNELLKSYMKNILFTVWRSRWGFDKFSWPLWADKDETTKDWFLWNVTQVVGHTKVPSIQVLPGIIYCDCLEYWNWKPLILDIEWNE